MTKKTNEIEIRAGIPVEIRTDENGIKVSGYAAVFGEVADIGGWFRETVERGAFKDAVANNDVVFLVNHEGLPLARTKSGTLKLEEDEKGLRMETSLDPEDPDVLKIVGKMKRGDLDKMSFQFRALRQEWDDLQEPPLRTIKEVELIDVSIVTDPAYQGTDIGLRSLEKHRKSKGSHAVQRRCRMRMGLAIRERDKGA